jgi:hypothetical protein
MVILCERSGIYAGISVTTPDPASQTFLLLVFLGDRALVLCLIGILSPVVTEQSFLSHAPMTLRTLPPTLVGMISMEPMILISTIDEKRSFRGALPCARGMTRLCPCGVSSCVVVDGSHPDAHSNTACLSASSAHRTPDRQSITSKRVSWPLREGREDHRATPAPP